MVSDIPITILLAVFTTVVLSFDPPEVPLGWTAIFPCAVDFPSPILTKVNTTVSPSLTVKGCIELCDASGYDILYAGVENGNECHCGTGLAAAPEAVDASECETPCSGDFELSCGGSWRIQIYQSPALPGNTATTWHPQGCWVDTSASPVLRRPITQTFASNVDLVFQCNAFCQHRSYQWAGVENGVECQCGATGFDPNAQAAPGADCDQALCPLPNNEGMEVCGGPQRLWVLQYDFVS
ncbi:hypothetical protein C8T65DRAFT_669973 [Cerioporus squamosus]|nr:hypothetical protein C8T65DRAFT_669973 [Cerioporus squamosus]